jgi:hypothetical protein
MWARQREATEAEEELRRKTANDPEGFVHKGKVEAAE